MLALLPLDPAFLTTCQLLASPPSAANLDAENVLETSTCVLSTRLRIFVPVLESQNNPFFVTTYYGQFSLSASHLPTA